MDKLNVFLDPTDIVSIGVANKRNTVVVWDLLTGNRFYPAIVSDLRTRKMVTVFKMSSKTSLVQTRSDLS